MIPKVGNVFNLRQWAQTLNALVDFVNGFNSADGIIEVKGNKSVRLNVDRLRARIPKIGGSGSSGGVQWAICAEDAPATSYMQCYIGVTQYSSVAVYKIGNFVLSSSTVWKSLQNDNKGNTPAEGEWWTKASPSTDGEIVYFTLLASAGGINKGHLSLVEGTWIPVMMRNNYYRCIIPLEGTEDCT